MDKGSMQTNGTHWLEKVRVARLVPNAVDLMKAGPMQNYYSSHHISPLETITVSTQMT